MLIFLLKARGSKVAGVPQGQGAPQDGRGNPPDRDSVHHRHDLQRGRDSRPLLRVLHPQRRGAGILGGQGHRRKGRH